MIRPLNKQRNMWEVTIGERIQKVSGTIYDARRVELNMMFHPLRNLEDARSRQQQARRKMQQKF